MRIGWDSDGVLYRFTKAYHSWMNLNHGMSLDLEAEAQTWNWFTEWSQTVEEFKQAMDESVDAGHLFWQGELYEPETPQLLAQLKALGHSNHLVTYRFSGKTRCAKAATEYFYASQGIEFDSITYSKDKTVVDVDFFLEDNLANYDVLDAAGVKVYLVNRPYNQENDSRRRVDSVKEYVNEVLNSYVSAS